LESKHYVERRVDGKYFASIDSGSDYIKSGESITLFETVDAAVAAVDALLEERTHAR